MSKKRDTEEPDVFESVAKRHGVDLDGDQFTRVVQHLTSVLIAQREKKPIHKRAPRKGESTGLSGLT